MQWPPPRPQPSSVPTMLMTSDAGFVEQGFGGDVAVVGDHNAGFDGDQVVAAVPLWTLDVVHVAAVVDGSQLAQAEGGPNDLQEGLSLLSDLEPWRGVARPQGVRVDAVHNVWDQPWLGSSRRLTAA
jgi:hypothetical protein